MDSNTWVSVFAGIVGVLIGVVSSEELSNRSIKIELNKKIMDDALEYTSLVRQFNHSYKQWEDIENKFSRCKGYDKIDENSTTKDEALTDVKKDLEKLLMEVEPYQFKLETMLQFKRNDSLYVAFIILKTELEDNNKRINNKQPKMENEEFIKNRTEQEMEIKRSLESKIKKEVNLYKDESGYSRISEFDAKIQLFLQEVYKVFNNDLSNIFRN